MIIPITIVAVPPVQVVVVEVPPVQVLVLEVTTPMTLVPMGYGLQGPRGPTGSGDLSFQYAQGVASAIWLITHNLGKYPSVTVVDSAGEQVEGGIEFIDANSLRITFSAAFTGKAYLN